MATHSIILAWEIPWTVEPSYSQGGHKKSDSTECAFTHAHTHMIIWEVLQSLQDYILTLREVYFNQ